MKSIMQTKKRLKLRLALQNLEKRLLLMDVLTNREFNFYFMF